MVKKSEYIKKAFVMMSQKDRLYQSSSFWAKACKNIATNYAEQGLENFRNNKENLSYFVPTYGLPGNIFTEKSIKKVLDIFPESTSKKNHLSLDKYFNGELQAASDYRVYRATNNQKDLIDLLDFSESSVGNPPEQYSFEGNFFSRSALNYLLGLSFLKSSLPNFVPKTVLEIGGGFGTLGEILNQVSNLDIKYIDVDLPPIFLIAAEYIKTACSLEDKQIFLSELKDSDENIDIESLPLFSFFPSWEIERLRGKIDLFVNFISFQEMEPDIVKNYLNIVSSLEPDVILLRNMKEGKQKATKATVGVISPIMSEDYGKFLPHYELVSSNIIPFGYTTMDDFNSELLLFKRK